MKKGITWPRGFKAAGLHCGIKNSGSKDLALLVSCKNSLAYGLFTSNKVKAAPLEVSIEHLKNNHARAIIINSGNANCFTGARGEKDAKKMASLTARGLGVSASGVLVASTGIIGRFLPMKKVTLGIKRLCLSLSENSADEAAAAIMTTDTKLKQIHESIRIGATPVSIGAMAKGAGMIFPHLSSAKRQATMLCFITTDAAIDRAALKKSLDYAVSHSFNLISIDGCMSTNDMVLILANAMAENKKISVNSKNFHVFKTALTDVCKDLALKIVKDGEGASKFIRIKIKSASSLRSAKRAGFAIANSSLFKAACFGKKANLGRIIAAIGSVGISLKQKNTKIKISGLKKKDINLEVNLGQGKAESEVYTCDLSPRYVQINAN